MWDEWASSISQVGDYFLVSITFYGTNHTRRRKDAADLQVQTEGRNQFPDYSSRRLRVPFESSESQEIHSIPYRKKEPWLDSLQRPDGQVSRWLYRLQWI